MFNLFSIAACTGVQKFHAIYALPLVAYTFTRFFCCKEYNLVASVPLDNFDRV